MSTIITNYKNFRIETTNGSSLIYMDSDLLGCTHSDLKLNNSEDKAKIRINLFLSGINKTLKNCNL